MKASLNLAVFTLACASAPALASSFDCVAPDIPSRSVTREGVHRVQKQIKHWRACYAVQDASGQVGADAQKLDAQVDADIQKWMDATRSASSNPANAAVLAHIERERIRYMQSRHLR